MFSCFIRYHVPALPVRSSKFILEVVKLSLQHQNSSTKVQRVALFRVLLYIPMPIGQPPMIFFRAGYADDIEIIGCRIQNITVELLTVKNGQLITFWAQSPIPD